MFDGPHALVCVDPPAGNGPYGKDGLYPGGTAKLNEKGGAGVAGGYPGEVVLEDASGARITRLVAQFQG